MKSIIRFLALALTITFVTNTSLAQPEGDPEAAAFREDFLAGELSWEQVLERAQQEGEVNWFYWGGSDDLNTWVDTVVVPAMADMGIALRT
ncbi:MAG: ABC transporter substrate-binding protein, partial [Deinococcota bacterium]|nr:ABC transporter substrate-binding protein [Deinococcota bacterium]